MLYYSALSYIQGNAPCTASGYPLRTKDNSEKWAILTPSTGTITRGHPTGGKQHTLVLMPHFGGRVRKRAATESPYSPSNPCCSMRSGQGPSYFGFYQREEHMSRKHKSRFRGPRRAAEELQEYRTQNTYLHASI